MRECPKPWAQRRVSHDGDDRPLHPTGAEGEEQEVVERVLCARGSVTASSPGPTGRNLSRREMASAAVRGLQGSRREAGIAKALGALRWQAGSQHGGVIAACEGRRLPHPRVQPLSWCPEEPKGGYEAHRGRIPHNTQHLPKSSRGGRRLGPDCHGIGLQPLRWTSCSEP